MKKLNLISLFFAIMTITTACKQQVPTRENPLLSEWNTPFGIPPFNEIEVADYGPAFEQAMEMHNREIDSIVENTAAPSFENVILAYDNSGELLSTIENIFSLISSADTTPEMQELAQEIMPRVSAHYDNIIFNEALTEKVRTIYENRHSLNLDSLQIRLAEKTYKEFERAGATLDKEQKEELMTINGELAVAELKFGNNILAENAKYVLWLETEEDLEGLPEAVKNYAREVATRKGDSGKWAVTISKPSMIPFLTYSSRSDLREQVYTAYLEKCNHNDELDNKQIINQILSLRTRKAEIFGFDTYARYALDENMAKTPENVYNLLETLWTPALERAQEELNEMKSIKKAETGEEDFMPWDWWYYAEKLRKERYDLNQNELLPYFALENVRQGIFNLANRLYGITFSPANVPVYNNECTAYSVFDVDGTQLGVVIFDFFTRDSKSSGAWCGEFIPQSYKDGKRRMPIVNIVCNFSRPTQSTPSLLTIDDTETLFHEFGHGLHQLLADVPYRGLRDVEMDFVELPSQIMENWAMTPEMLQSYAIHFQSGAVIPRSMVNKIQRSALFNQGFEYTELLAASLSDMDIHNTKVTAEVDVNAFEREALNTRRGLIEQIAPRYHYPYFSHIFDGGYSAGYYSYIWAEVLDKDAYQAFVETGNLFDKKVAARFRTLLASGGMADGMDLYRAFRGKEPQREPLMRAHGLIDEQEITIPEPEEETEVEEEKSGADIWRARRRLRKDESYK